jgi:hypothetical protein
MKILPVGAEVFLAGGRADGRTDMTKLIVAFRNYANAPKNESKCTTFLLFLKHVGVRVPAHTWHNP